MWFPPLKLPAQVLPFVRIEAAPDAERLVGRDRVRQALAANRAHRADVPGFDGWAIAGRKEELRVGAHAERAGAHVRGVSDLVCASSCRPGPELAAEQRRRRPPGVCFHRRPARQRRDR